MKLHAAKKIYMNPPAVKKMELTDYSDGCFIIVYTYHYV